MNKQRQYYKFNAAKGIVQGVFYTDGRRLWRKLCAIEEAECHPNGRRRSEQQRANFLAALYAEHEQQLGIQGPRKIRSVGIREAFQNWIDLAQGIQSERTIKEHYAYTANLFVSLVGNFPLKEITIHHIDRFISALIERGNANTSINVRLASLKTFLRWAHERGYLQEIPKIKKLPTTRTLPRTFEEQDIARLFDLIQTKQESTANADHRRQYGLHLRFLVLVGHTGARLSEILHLRWNLIDFEQSELRIVKQPAFNVKERQEKIIPMNAALADHLRAWREAEPAAIVLFGKTPQSDQLMWADYHGVTAAISRHLKELGLHGIAKPIHSFRARFATALIHQGSDISTVQALLGHRNITTTQGYITFSGAAKRAAIEGISLPVSLADFLSK